MHWIAAHRRADLAVFANLGGEIGASVSVWQAGREVVTLAGGFCERERVRPWTADTPTLVWSANFQTSWCSSTTGVCKPRARLAMC